MSKTNVFMSKSFLEQERYSVLGKALSNLLEIAGIDKRVDVFEGEHDLEFVLVDKE